MSLQFAVLSGHRSIEVEFFDGWWPKTVGVVRLRLSEEIPRLDARQGRDGRLARSTAARGAGAQGRRRSRAGCAVATRPCC